MNLDYNEEDDKQEVDEEQPGYVPPARRSGISGLCIGLLTFVSLLVIGIVNLTSAYTPSEESGLEPGLGLNIRPGFGPSLRPAPQGNIYSVHNPNRKPGPKANTGSSPCRDPTFRREWRTLSNVEKQKYLKSVQCLWERPSRIGLNHSLYEDFPWVHSRIGNFSHNTPAFLAWHRYFLNIYERTLQEQCGYSGHLVYWDWTLDSEDMTASPVWDSENGFGGNGDINSNRSVGYGHCVTDGPFANRTHHYFGEEFIEHCLSRGFISKNRLKTVWNKHVNAEVVENTLSQPDYESFNIALEDGPHNAIPKSIRGDIFRVTSPNEPLFFLHHTQLDRVWWMWQQRNPEQRMYQYGHNGHTLDDVFLFDGFAPDRKVSEVISTETELLCYRY